MTHFCTRFNDTFLFFFRFCSNFFSYCSFLFTSTPRLHKVLMVKLRADHSVPFRRLFSLNICCNFREATFVIDAHRHDFDRTSFVSRSSR